MRKINILIMILIVASFALSTYAYKIIPGDQIASHWNTAGDVDGYMSKFWGVFLFPIITTFVFLLFLVIPKIDPLKKNFKKFNKQYEAIMSIIILFLTYVFALSIIFNFGYTFNMTYAILPPVGILFFYIGMCLPKLKQNWFVGIRTPWTISNKKVWEKTHFLGGKLFRILGIIIAISVFAPAENMIWIILIPTAAAIIGLFIYSYLEYKKIKK